MNVKSQCDHSKTVCVPGPRVPVRYGSFETEICCACAHWRTTTHNPGPWRLLRDLPEACEPIEEM